MVTFWKQSFRCICPQHTPHALIIIDNYVCKVKMMRVLAPGVSYMHPICFMDPSLYIYLVPSTQFQ